MNMVAVETANTRFRNRYSGSTGSAARRSTRDERDQQDRADDAEADDDRRSPGVLRPAPGDGEQDRADGAHEQRRAGVVDAVHHARVGQVEHDARDDQRHGADGEVHVEHPAPRQLVDEEAAQERADHARQREHGAHVALVAAALAGRDDVADDRHRERHQAAGADALQAAERDQLDHALREAGQRRSEQEHDDRELEACACGRRCR